MEYRERIECEEHTEKHTIARKLFIVVFNEQLFVVVDVAVFSDSVRCDHITWAKFVFRCAAAARCPCLCVSACVSGVRGSVIEIIMYF